MGIEFKNHVTGANSGEITTVSEWFVWDCLGKKLASTPPVVLRNILLAANHPTPDDRFCIGEIPEKATDAALLNPFKIDAKSDKSYQLDLASGSRTHGRFTFSIQPVGLSYYGEQWKRIIYGSIMHTGCKKMVYKVLNYVITDDTIIDADGFQEDDPVNGKNWGTGDSHAKASAAFMDFLGLEKYVDPDPYRDQTPIGDRIPIQFRLSEFKKWVGKGTVAYSPDMDGSGVDIAIPLSSLKGNKPALGNHTGKLLFGVVFEAEERRSKLGWMLLQWFSFETLQEDNIITNLETKCQRLKDSYNNIQNLADLLRIDQDEAAAELQESDTLQSEAEYENTMIRIIQADKNGVLLLHPYVVRRIKERMRSLWLNLAKSAGIRFFSLMTQPDEWFTRYHIKRDGRIVGGKVFCAPDFQEGEYIVYCNPMRHWGDVQLWQNKHEGLYTDSSGVMASSTELFLTIGRDFDGDFVQLIRASAYPAIAQAIREFSDSPNVDKLPKVPLSGNLQQIAINSMNDATGIVASLLGRARSAGVENVPLLIPAGGQQEEDKEFRIIDFLSQELQIAVDSIKSAYPNNMNGLNFVGQYLTDVGANAPWLKDFKDPACYRDRTCQVNSTAEDTVSRVVRLVNSYWRSPDLNEQPSPRIYQSVLFGDVPHDDAQYNYAIKHRDSYRADMRKAIEWKEANDGDSRMIREVAQSTKLRKPKILAATKPGGNVYSPESWASAYWKAAHQAETGDAGFVFMIFGDEIVDKLRGAKHKPLDFIEVYGVAYGKWPLARWSGQQVSTRVISVPGKAGLLKLAIEINWPDAQTQTGWHLLGFVGDKESAYLLPGATSDRKIYSFRFSKTGSTTAVRLFDTAMTDEEIASYLNVVPK